jgi:hypothetical protein
MEIAHVEIPISNYLFQVLDMFILPNELNERVWFWGNQFCISNDIELKAGLYIQRVYYESTQCHSFRVVFCIKPWLIAQDLTTQWIFAVRLPSCDSSMRALQSRREIIKQLPSAFAISLSSETISLVPCPTGKQHAYKPPSLIHNHISRVSLLKNVNLTRENYKASLMNCDDWLSYKILQACSPKMLCQ